MGTALEIFGESTAGLLGYGFIYTNKESLSIGTGALLEDLIESGLNVNDMLDRFKAHPAIAPLIAGGETLEYSGHLIPEGGYNRLPQVFADGAVVVGDAAQLVNPVNREGGNLAMLSGKLAAQAIIEAKANDDFSAMSLSRYRELLDESVVMADLHKIRNVTDFAHARPHLLREYPQRPRRRCSRSTCASTACRRRPNRRRSSAWPKRFPSAACSTTCRRGPVAPVGACRRATNCPDRRRCASRMRNPFAGRGRRGFAGIS